MPFIHHSYCMPLVKSVEADFETSKWTVEILDDSRVGAGTYLMIPVMDNEEAEIIMQAIRDLRQPSVVTQKPNDADQA